MNRQENRRLERVQYWQGQRLRSKDFLDLEAVEAQRRWWHNRALHQAYGVHEGFAVSSAPGGIRNGVSVSRGVAYDVHGHELILERPQTIPLPVNLHADHKGQATASLLIRYRPPRGSQQARLSEVCFGQKHAIAIGTCEFFWKLKQRVVPSDGVVIGNLRSSTGKFGPDYDLLLDPSFSPVAPRPIASPLLASGSTVPGNTPWQTWNFLSYGAVGVQTYIDTSAAGFTRIPCYFAWLQGPLWNPQTLQLVPAIFPSITGESVGGFTFRLWLTFPEPTVDFRTEARVATATAAASALPPMNFITDPDAFKIYAQQQKLYVNWIACQMRVPISSCVPQAGSGASADMNLVSVAP